MDSFEAMRRLATTLGVSAPESNEDVFNVSFINSINKSAYHVIKEAGEKIDELQKENERLSKIEKAFIKWQG